MKNGGHSFINLTSRRFQSNSTDDDILEKYRIFNASSKPMYMIAKVTYNAEECGEMSKHSFPSSNRNLHLVSMNLMITRAITMMTEMKIPATKSYRRMIH